MQTTPIPPQAQPASREDDDAYYRAVLHELVEIGTGLARQLKDTAAKHPEADHTIAFDRVARTIRRTIALARHIATSPPKARMAPAERAKAREKIIRTIEDAIEVKGRHTKGFDNQAYFEELNERLLDDQLEQDLLTRPIDDIIEEIARDLNVNAQERSWRHKRRTPTTLAALRHRAAALPPLPPGEGRGEGNNQSSLKPVSAEPVEGQSAAPSSEEKVLSSSSAMGTRSEQAAGMPPPPE